MNSVEQYISQFEPGIQARLLSLRKRFFEVLPATEESIRYNMPAFRVGKDYLYFAAYKKHIGFYPVYGYPEIAAEIAAFRAPKTKDSLHFAHDQPLPLDLVEKIIRLKSKEQ
jgi:uncharacterized protein YdhG (YjbR/CyaY superfamily)